MGTWNDDFSHDYIADNTYTLVDVEDTGMGYEIAGGKLTFTGWQQFLDPRWPASDGTAHDLSVDVDATSGPPSLLTIGWSSPDWQNILSDVSASLQFNNFHKPDGSWWNDYFTRIEINGYDNVTHQSIGTVSAGDQHALAGLTPPFTFEISTAITPDAYTATMKVIKNGQTLYTKTVGTTQSVWAWAMMGGNGVFPGIDGRSFSAVRFAPPQPNLVLDRWSHDTPVVPTPSVVYVGQKAVGALRPPKRLASVRAVAVVNSPPSGVNV